VGEAIDGLAEQRARLFRLSTGHCTSCRSRKLKESERARWRFIAETTAKQVNGCWVWTGASKGGVPWTRHGRYQGQGHDPSATIYEAYHGPLNGREVSRSCGNPMCVREHHLRAIGEATAAPSPEVAPPVVREGQERPVYANNKSGEKGIYQTTRGWLVQVRVSGVRETVGMYASMEEAVSARDEYLDNVENHSGRGKVTEDDVRDMRIRHEGGEDIHLIAARYGLHRSAVSRIVRGKAWRQVDDKPKPELRRQHKASGVPGVSWEPDRRTWRARVGNVKVGRFETVAEAARAIEEYKASRTATVSE
jgi:hypothetical protein